MNTFTIPEGTKEVKIDKIDNKVIIEFIPQVEKFEPKDGDIVYWYWQNADGLYSKNLAILKDEYSTYFCVPIIKHDEVTDADRFCQESFDFVFSKNTKEFRLATDSEKQLLFDKLAEQGYKWNDEEKKIEKVRWRAKKGESYWTFSFDKVIEASEDNELADDRAYNRCQYFQHKEQAEKALEAVKNLLLNTEW